MYKRSLIIWLLLFLPFVKNTKAQNTSNKGKEFWIAYAGHIDGTKSKMYLYITSDVNTTAAVNIGGQAIAGSPFTITANAILAVPLDPTAYIGSSNLIEVNKAIQVVAARPVVVYAHIFNAARSAATLVLPTKVLGREYFTTSYVQNKPASNNPGLAYSEFTIVAVEDNTLIDITPKAKDIESKHAAGQTFQISLKKGEIYQYQSETDLSGSHILSIASSGGICKPIAVFSGSTWVGFCSDLVGATNGGDNLYQQLYPITAWGKEFITAPFIHKPYDIFRIYFSKDNTILRINGAVVTSSTAFNKSDFYEFNSSDANTITASEPISVVQYQISQSCDPVNLGLGNNVPAPHPGDPEMTILNPVEQTLSKITVYSALRNQTNPATNITQHYINVVIQNQFTSSFTINGLPPEGIFKSIGTTGYSYLQEDVTVRSAINPTHVLMADGGFSAIAYGYGNVESYGYLAGADAKNLYENLQIKDVGTGFEKTDICIGETGAFTLILPYLPLSITWIVDGLREAPIPAPIPDSVNVINGVTVYKFNYNRNLPFHTAEPHEIKVVALNPNPSGCDPNEEISIDFDVFDLPVAKFSVVPAQTCIGVPITFTDQSISNGKGITKWHWDFGDGNGEVIRRSAAPFEYKYTSGGDKSITLWVESESGCSSTVTFPFVAHVNELPEAKFKFTTPSCETKAIIFTDESVPVEGTITKWTWNFGDANAGNGNPNVSTIQNPVHTYSKPGTYTVSLIVETDKGCQSPVLEQQVLINLLPVVDFDTPDACVSDAAVTFKNRSTNVDGTITGLSYVWDFGDPPGSGGLNISTATEGLHKYHAAAIYTVKLIVTTSDGCSMEVLKMFRVNGATPLASFEVLDKDNLCSNKDFQVKDNSTIAGFDNITRLEWYLDDILVAEKRNPAKNDTYALNYPAFTFPLTKPTVLKLIAYSGDVAGPCQSFSEQNIVLHAAPVVKFEALIPICINAGRFQIEAAELGNVPGQGIFSGRGITANGLFDPAAAGVGMWNITYTFTADNKCSDHVVQSIVVKPIPKVNVASDIYVLVGGTIQVNASVTEPGLKFKWAPAIGLNRDDVLNPIITAEEDVDYTLTVTSMLNCDETVKVKLHALKEINPSNAFSPNGDNINDTWEIKYLNTYPNAMVQIFNRYGQIVFSSHGYANPFDGNYQGNPLPVGTYYYIITPNNGRQKITGSLTLIR